MRRRSRALLCGSLPVLFALVALAGCSGDSGASRPLTLPAGGYVHSPLVSDARIAPHTAHLAGGDGDLWPNCWSRDGNIYTAYGDGMGFGYTASDIGTARISGGVDALKGTTLAIGDQVGQVWSGEDFTRKPTGMLCVGGTLYLAVQDLRKDFNEAPAATIVRSDDGGKTWTWDHSAPMFSGHVFTTIFFADYGKNGQWGADAGAGDYAYAYGLDGNWRDSFDNSVPDPQDLYLARVPRTKVQDRSAWQFYTGTASGKPTWSRDIDAKKPVLHDARLRHPSDTTGTDGQTVGASNLSVISQGGVLYDAPLKTYIYTSWTELTFEFYAARHPWGPWKLFFSKNWGAYPWSTDAYGGYATTLPSKFLSADGRSAWLQSNVCPCAPAGMSSYDFGLRRFELSPG